MKSIKIGKHAIPVWLIPVILISMIGVTVGYYVWTTLTIPFEVKEPLEVLSYPSHLSLYAGDTSEFNITLMNHASANFSVVLIFHLSNATYQADYVMFSNVTYLVVPGVQNVTAAVTVTPDAPPVSSSLTISLARFAPTPNRTQQELLYMSNLHAWYITTSPGWAEAAFVLQNTGGRDVVIQSITARSQPSAWSNIYYWITSTATISALSPTSTQPSGSTISPLINGTAQNLNVASGALALKAGYTMVIYIDHPDSVGQNDVGTPVAVTVFTANAQWTQECNVQAAQPPADQFCIVSVTFTGTSPNYTGINMSIQNTGSSSWTITSPCQVNSLTNVPVTATGTGATSLTCAAGKSIWVFLTTSCTSGNQYSITLSMASGTKITYVTTAP